MKNSEVLKNLIESRRSTFPKSYTAGSLDQIILQEILSSASFAPQHKKTKPARFRIFEGEDKDALGKELARIYQLVTPPQFFLQKKHEDIVHKISLTNAIIVLNINFSGLVPEWEEIASVGMSVQNMYLTATAHNVGCYWSSPALIHHLNQFLKLDENQKCLGLFYLGKIN